MPVISVIVADRVPSVANPAQEFFIKASWHLPPMAVYFFLFFSNMLGKQMAIVSRRLPSPRF